MSISSAQQQDLACEAVDAVDPTYLPDIELYRTAQARKPGGQVFTSTEWDDALGALAQQYKAFEKDDIALAVFAAYVARLSESGDAVLAVQFSRQTVGAPSFIAFDVALAPDMTFDDFLGQVVRQRVVKEMRVSARAEGFLASPMPLAFTFGATKADEVDADIHLIAGQTGVLSFVQANTLELNAVSLVAERMSALTRSVLNDPEKPLVHHDIMSARERRLVVQTWNATDVDYGYDGGLVGMFERQAHETPDQPAVIFKDDVLSFAEFNARVNRLARYLRSKGVGKDRFVCLCMERSFELVIGLWATLKAGGAYVPLNTEDPASRMSEIIEDCRPKVVLTQEHIRERIESDHAEILVLPEGGDFQPEDDGSDLEIEIGRSDLAYMIYTSGSTGKPKGVVVEHEAIHNRVVWMHEEYGLTPEDRVLQKTPYTFDVSVWEFLWSFAYGSALVVAEPGGHMAIGYLYHLIKTQNVTHLHFVPSVMRLFLMAPRLDELKIKKLFCSGEALPFDLVQIYYGKANAEAEVHNLYGPTEAAVDVSYWECPRNPDRKTIPIGKPVTNTGLYILDEFDRPVPVGVPGELHIGGVQLARGYWAREDLTVERFIPCPVDDAPHDRLYRTGDLAYFEPDGNIMYLGRNDFQVKINGVRMELGEIEAAIRDQGGVRDVVVLAEEEAGNKVLVAYVVSDRPGTDTADALKDGVKERCPVYYVPRDIRFLQSMPLTVSGKINRKQLADLPRL
ncbi:MAG: amino acid adenylation domain-containing protein [Pseudomonadota bacterium]